MRILFALAALLLACTAVHAQAITSTRTSTADWACENADGTRATQTNYQRFDTAFAECAQLAAKDGKPRYVQGGRYRITVTLPAPITPPPATTGSAKLLWTAPTARTDGSPLTDLAGYHIRYGNSPTALTQTLTVANPAALSADVTSLASGAWYFAVIAYTATGAESASSLVVNKTIH